MISSAITPTEAAADSYTDLASVNAIRGLSDKNQALEKIAQQFESMMMRMMLKSMRSANQVFAEGNYLSSHEGDTYRDMLDDQLALTLSQGKGMGLAEVMVRQLQGRFGDVDTAANRATTDITAYLNHRNSDDNPMLGVKIPDRSATANTATQASPPLEFDGSVHQFVERLYPMAEKYAQALGVAPEVLIAQSALETGWGVKVNSKHNGGSSFNLFNIKADKRWQGESVTVPTMEVRNGVAVKERAAFRVYSSPEQSFADYVDFIRGGARYSQALQSDSSESYIRHLSAAGYATDTDYADKILRILNSEDLRDAVQKAVSQKPLAVLEN